MTIHRMTPPAARSNGNVVAFPEQEDPNPVVAALNRALEHARAGRIKSVLVTGFDAQNDVFILTSGDIDNAQMNWIGDGVKHVATQCEENPEPRPA